jgi:hypothetical protein
VPLSLREVGVRGRKVIVQVDSPREMPVELMIASPTRVAFTG